MKHAPLPSPCPTQKPMYGFRRRLSQIEKKIQKRTFKVSKSLKKIEEEEELKTLGQPAHDLGRDSSQSQM